jgi:hypothetical protein
MNRTIPILLSASLLTGCVTFTRVAGALAYPAAAATETRVGADCIRAEEAGGRPSRVPIFTLRQARRGFDAIFRPRISQSEAEGLDGTRDDVDRVCPSPFPAAPPAPAPAAEPAPPG